MTGEQWTHRPLANLTSFCVILGLVVRAVFRKVERLVFEDRTEIGLIDAAMQQDRRAATGFERSAVFPASARRKGVELRRAGPKRRRAKDGG